VPELPDVELYLHALRPRLVGQQLERVRIASPALVRTYDPPVRAIEGLTVTAVSRLGKRVVWHLTDDLFVVIHLMIAGRFQWKKKGTALPGRVGIALFDFPAGTLILTEAGSKRRASLHVVRGEAALAELNPGGLDVLTAAVDDFTRVLTSENHTLKRALTDPHLFDGIGNAYSDEILHAAQLSPMTLTSRLDPAQIARLHAATIKVLTTWRDALIAEAGEKFPEKVTAFRAGMAVHGRYLKPCPVCATPVQRIRYAANEVNYCPKCQTGGKLLADRALSQLLKKDWPKSLDELEEYKAKRRV
jgi:formamidopyrimidine-DNA glycosylase